ncbi:hypothetical protein VNO77_17230 [Canavalia gladiata]|uniref:Uncharacterized protein n=1 Tax=Canavalia gladiata TaxID=3824 RepID=A0AAN9LM41_CANGL
MRGDDGAIDISGVVHAVVFKQLGLMIYGGFCSTSGWVSTHMCVRCFGLLATWSLIEVALSVVMMGCDGILGDLVYCKGGSLIRLMFDGSIATWTEIWWLQD